MTWHIRKDFASEPLDANGPTLRPRDAETVTLGPTHWPRANAVMARNRRIGCSLSGIAQFLAPPPASAAAASGATAASSPSGEGEGDSGGSDSDGDRGGGSVVARGGGGAPPRGARSPLGRLHAWCERAYDEVQDADAALAERFGVPRSVKTTCIKPSGTVSLLAGATPGMHYPEVPS
jgi:hypothetical protein